MDLINRLSKNRQPSKAIGPPADRLLFVRCAPGHRVQVAERVEMVWIYEGGDGDGTKDQLPVIKDLQMGVAASSGPVSNRSLTKPGLIPEGMGASISKIAWHASHSGRRIGISS